MRLRVAVLAATSALAGCDCGSSRARPIDDAGHADGSVGDATIAPDDDASIVEPPPGPRRCAVRCTPAEIVVSDGGTGPYGYWSVTPLVAVDGGFVVLMRSTHRAVTEPFAMHEQLQHFVRFLDERGRALAMRGFVPEGDEERYAEVVGQTLRATPDGLEAVIAYAANREDRWPDEPPADIEIRLLDARWDATGDAVDVRTLGSLGAPVAASGDAVQVAIGARGDEGVAAIALGGTMRAARLALGAGGASMGTAMDVLVLPESRPVSTSIGVAMIPTGAVAFVGGGASSTPGAMRAFGAVGSIDPPMLASLDIVGTNGDPPPRVAAWRDGIAIARHARPITDVSLGSIRIELRDAEGETTRALEVPTDSGIPPAFMDFATGDDGEVAIVWLSRALDGAPELALHVSPLDVPDACEILDVEPAATVPAHLAPPVVGTAARGTEVHLLVTGDDESWLRVESCAVETRDDGSRR